MSNLLEKEHFKRKLNSKNERIAQELEELMDCAERYALIEHLTDEFKKKERNELVKLNSIEKYRLEVKNNREILLRSQSLAAMKIRIFFEKRKGFIFDINEMIDPEIGNMPIRKFRDTIFTKIMEFSQEISLKLLKQKWKDEKKRNIVQNCVVQETTNAAFGTIQSYLKTLRNKPSFISIECMIVDRKLWVNSEQIRLLLKEPISVMCSLENVRMSTEDCETWQEEAMMNVDVLSHDNISIHPFLQPYTSLIEDYKVSPKLTEEELIKMYDDSTHLQIRLTKAAKQLTIRCFVLRLESVWIEMERRIRSFRNQLKMAIRRKFTTLLNKLLHDFRKYDRALQYRSIDPSMMLSNKAQVDLMLQNEIGDSAKQFVDVYDKVFEITQHISLDTSQMDSLLQIASLRLSLPQCINDHAHFFQKRISTFLHFVNKKQAKVMTSVQKAMEKLKIVQTMGNPQEVETYLLQMAKLRPMLDSLITEIEDLNKFEKAVDIQVSDVTKMRHFVEEIESLQSLFVATSGYYKHVNSFFESRRTLVNIDASRNFIEQFTVQLSVFESSLTTHRAAKHFIAYARNEVDSFKKNFSVAEVMSCRRLLDAHWLRMSEIVGFDLTPYANSSIAQICELGLEAHLQQLKPIAFSAEREATAADQLHSIVTFWSQEHLEMKFYIQWKLSLAIRLRDLHNRVQNDINTLKHMTNVEQITDDSLPQWTEWTNRAETILKAWSDTQQKWMRVANIFVTCRDVLQEKAYYIQHKSVQRQSLLTVDFVYSNETNRFIPRNLADNWSSGHIILLIGEMCSTRSFALKLANCLCSNLRIVNSHHLLESEFLERLAKCISMSNWFVLLENVDLLDSQLVFLLFKLLSNQASPFPRLFLSSTEEIKNQLPASISVEHLRTSDHLVHELMDDQHKASPSFKFEASTPLSSVRSSSIPTASRLPTQSNSSVLPPSSPNSILLEKLDLESRIVNVILKVYLSFIATYRYAPDIVLVTPSNIEISGCCGPMAKETLKETLNSFAENVIWIYVDVFVRDQLVVHSDEFAASPSGILFEVLSPNTLQSNGSESERSYHSTISTNSVCINTIVVFYGFSEFWNIFPFISPLFLKKDGFSAQIPPFLTLDDGSTHWPQENVQFLMCIPDEEGYHLNTVKKFDIPFHLVNENLKMDISRSWRKQWQKKYSELFNKISLIEIMDELVDRILSPISSHFSISFLWPSTLFEVIYQDLTEVIPLSRMTSVNDTLRITVILATANYVSIFSDDQKKVETKMSKVLISIREKLSIQIPEDVCNWKISYQDATKLVKWEDEPFCQSSIDKDSAIGNIMIVTPHMDRLLFYSIRLLSSGHNILVHGPPYSRKTMFVKMISKYLTTSSNGEIPIEFLWLDGKSRVGNDVAQKKFANIVEICEKTNQTKQLYIVIDRFYFTEPLLPIIEFFVDHKTYWKDGKLCKSDAQIRMIIITDEADYAWLHKTKALASTFVGIAMPPSTKCHDQKPLVQSLIAANFTAKSFSSEYHHILESFSSCIVEIVKKPYLKNLSSMALATRLAKSFFFAFPDNCPDPNALLRLFIHESARVIGDAIDPFHRSTFSREFEILIDENFNTTQQAILKHIAQISDNEEDEEEEEEEEGDKKEGVKRKQQTTIDMFDLIYSEVDAHDVVDGLSYEPVVDRVQFQRSIENFLFEHHRNHPKDRIRLFVDWETSGWVQRVMRVIRQASEHMVLTAAPNSGRTQVVKAACVACNATMMHMQVDATCYDTFISRWEYALSRAINIIANTNQHVVILVHLDFCYEKVEPRWMEQIKLWIECPNTQHLVSDEQLHAMGEQLIECEKNLATQMQTIGLRLPGQRMCKYLPVETLKEPQALRKVLESRIFDALHVMFLVDPQFKSDFSWCTIFHVPVRKNWFGMNENRILGYREIGIIDKSIENNIGL
uniref:DHC_N2 domain-containing protein n=1 Tax=Caenorhabditis tropicalis TaxID=1561998 RepID=A0A1I7TLZ6_9PELO